MEIRSSARAVDAQWLTSTLREAGFDGTVERVSWQSIGAGQVGENARFEISGTGNLPQTVVGKFPSDDPTSRQTGVALNNYAREVFFYETIAPTVDIQVPQVFGTGIDPATQEFFILMEDLAPGVQVDQMDECTVDQAALALEQLARLQGPRWGDAALAGSPLLVRANGGGGGLSMFLGGFLERYGERLEPGAIRMVEAAGVAASNATAYDGPLTLIHIDYRLDNMVFGGPRPLTVLDWQSVNLGCALNDASYFMGTSLKPSSRAAEEKHLLRHYLDVLGSYGVDLGWDLCWALYRRYAPAGLNMAIVASMIVGETQRGNDMFMTMAQRSIAMCEDHGALEPTG